MDSSHQRNLACLTQSPQKCALALLITLAAVIAAIVSKHTVAWADDDTRAVATESAVELPEALFGDDADARLAAIERLKQQPHAPYPHCWPRSAATTSTAASGPAKFCWPSCHAMPKLRK